MKIDILTIFPEMFVGPFSESIIKRAVENKLVEINIHNLRDWTTDKHNTVDDRPYGGGPGMVMRVDVIDRALQDLKSKIQNPSDTKDMKGNQKSKVVLLSAKGEKYTQQKAQEFSKENNLILIAGHYEGVDHRVYDLVDEVVSIGDYVLTGGELPIMVMVDSLVRLMPGVLGDENSLMEESHTKLGFVEYPQYTRPEEYKSMKVPDVLLSGDHGKVAMWRKENSKTLKDQL